MISWLGLPAEREHLHSRLAKCSRISAFVAGHGYGLVLVMMVAGSMIGEAHAADGDQVKLLMDTKVCAECDLSGANLSGRDFSGSDMTDSNAFQIDLRSADLRGAKLIGVNFRGGNLAEATLAEAKLMRSNLEGANLSGADLRGATLTHAALGNAVLDGVNLSGAKLDKSNGLKQDQLENACGDDSTSLPEGLSLEACVERDQEDPEVGPAK